MQVSDSDPGGNTAAGDRGTAADIARAAPWNRSVPSQPHAVVRVHSAEDVAATVRDAAKAGRRVAVRSTGHGATPIGDDVLLVHTAAMTECTIHPSSGSARIGAGTTWQQVVEAAAQHGLAPICGSAPRVGAVGYLTGGGIGPMARTFGVSSDFVRAIEAVTGTGDVFRATPAEHEDLFWGLRGGKATLGIVTAMEIDLVPLTAFYGGCLWFDSADSVRVLQAWRRFCEDLPDEATTSAAIARLPPDPRLPGPIAGRQTLAIRFAWAGASGDGEACLDAVRQAAAPVLDDVGTRPYTEIGAVHGDPVDPLAVHDHFALLRELPEVGIRRLLEAVGQRDNVQSVVELRLLGGAIARDPVHRSAVCHRDAAYSLFVSGVQRPGVDTDVHAAQILAALAEWSDGGLLPNFAASDDPGRIDRCYDPATLERLRTLADRYDPTRVLRTGQVVSG